MAHELDFSRGRAAMAYRGATPWHGLGQSLEAGADLQTWERAAGMDWEVMRAPVQYAAGNGLQAMDDRHVLYRSDNSAPLGVVSDGYKIVQPGAVLSFFRDLTERAGFQMETAGCLFDGRRFWAMARATSDVAILDNRDTVGGYLLLSSSADGTLSTEGRFTTVRVVCNNTLSLARGSSKGKAGFSLTHRSTFDEAAAKSALGVLRPDQVRDQFGEQMEQFRALARTKIDRAEMVRMTLEAFGHDPAKMDARDLRDAAEKPGAVAVGTLAMGRGLIGGNMEGAGPGTAWGWLNAVTQYADHSARARSQSNRLDSAWFGRGDALKSKALEVAVQVAGGRTEYRTIEAAPEPMRSGASLLDDVLAATPAMA